jgi:hypothetical protein
VIQLCYYLIIYHPIKKVSETSYFHTAYIALCRCGKTNFHFWIKSNRYTVHELLSWDQLLNLILQSELVISTSLHGNLFKFHDYYEGTNRTLRYATT